MDEFSRGLMCDTRIVPVHAPNQISTVEKLANGGLRIVQNSGNTFDIAADDKIFQDFAIYTMLNSEAQS